MTPEAILHTLQTAAWHSDAFYVAMAWTIGAVVWVVAFLAGIVASILDGDGVAELLLWAPFWGFLCLLIAVVIGAPWGLWLGLTALVGSAYLLVLFFKAVRALGSLRSARV